jgi:hypothetical protein
MKIVVNKKVFLKFPFPCEREKIEKFELKNDVAKEFLLYPQSLLDTVKRLIVINDLS